MTKTISILLHSLASPEPLPEPEPSSSPPSSSPRGPGPHAPARIARPKIKHCTVFMVPSPEVRERYTRKPDDPRAFRASGTFAQVAQRVARFAKPVSQSP